MTLNPTIHTFKSERKGAETKGSGFRQKHARDLNSQCKQSFPAASNLRFSRFQILCLQGKKRGLLGKKMKGGSKPREQLSHSEHKKNLEVHNGARNEVYL